MVQYKIDILNLITNGQVRSDCADITFINSGTSTIILNNALSLPSGQSISITANNDEIDRTIYTYTFQGAGTNSLVVFRKIYL